VHVGDLLFELEQGAPLSLRRRGAAEKWRALSSPVPRETTRDEIETRPPVWAAPRAGDQAERLGVSRSENMHERREAHLPGVDDDV
jgi:hypothetical protein